MLPPKCFTCGKFLADIQLEYESKKIQINSNSKLSKIEKNLQMKHLLNQMYITSWCCRAQVITYCDLIEIVF